MKIRFILPLLLAALLLSGCANTSVSVTPAWAVPSATDAPFHAQRYYVQDLQEMELGDITESRTAAKAVAEYRMLRIPPLSGDPLCLRLQVYANGTGLFERRQLVAYPPGDKKVVQKKLNREQTAALLDAVRTSRFWEAPSERPEEWDSLDGIMICLEGCSEGGRHLVMRGDNSDTVDVIGMYRAFIELDGKLFGP